MIRNEKIEEVKKEVFNLFKNNAKNDYQNPKWIFPHHFDVMADMADEMCQKYGGDLLICTSRLFARYWISL